MDSWPVKRAITVQQSGEIKAVIRLMAKDESTKCILHESWVHCCRDVYCMEWVSQALRDREETWKLLLEWWLNTNKQSRRLCTSSPDLFPQTVRQTASQWDRQWDGGAVIICAGGWKLWWWSTSPQMIIITWVITMTTSGWRFCVCISNQS